MEEIQMPYTPKYQMRNQLERVWDTFLIKHWNIKSSWIRILSIKYLQRCKIPRKMIRYCLQRRVFTDGPGAITETMVSAVCKLTQSHANGHDHCIQQTEVSTRCSPYLHDIGATRLKSRILMILIFPCIKIQGAEYGMEELKSHHVERSVLVITSGGWDRSIHPFKLFVCKLHRNRRQNPFRLHILIGPDSLRCFVTTWSAAAS